MGWQLSQDNSERDSTTTGLPPRAPGRTRRLAAPKGESNKAGKSGGWIRGVDKGRGRDGPGELQVQMFARLHTGARLGSHLHDSHFSSLSVDP